MKWALVIWLLSAGVGLSYSVIAERRRQIVFLKAMEYSLKQLAYYMYQWRMPVEELIKQMIKEEQLLKHFYMAIQQKLLEKHVENFGTIWQTESVNMLKKERIPENTKVLWQDLFLHMPLEPEGVHKKLLLKCSELTAKREEIEEKYKSEQRLVFTMGFFTSAFLCLILW